MSDKPFYPAFGGSQFRPPKPELEKQKDYLKKLYSPSADKPASSLEPDKKWQYAAFGRE